MAILLNYFELGGSFQREQSGFVMEISRYGERNETECLVSEDFSLVVNSFLQQIFTEYLRCDRQCAWIWR